MDKKTWDILRTVLGVYLIWLGISLLIQVTEEKPRDMALMSALAVIFIFVGLGYALYHLDKIFNLKKRLKIFAFHKKQKEEKDFVSESDIEEDMKTKLHIMPSSEETKLIQEEKDTEYYDETADEQSESEENESTAEDAEQNEELKEGHDEQSEEKSVFIENDDIVKETVKTESKEEKVAEEEDSDEEVETCSEEIEKDYEEK